MVFNEMKTAKPILLGCGILSWPKWERQSDRYGTVSLRKPGTSDESVSDDENLRFSKELADMRGSLYAIVIETRESPHCGDAAHGFFPVMPEKGEKVILGSGTLIFHTTKDWGFLLPKRGGLESVGLAPDDGRDHLWLDGDALYRLHYQTVELYFEPLVDQGCSLILRRLSRKAGYMSYFPIFIVYRKWRQLRSWYLWGRH